ncbi:hypothetical protein KJ068_30945, partial [bacterium]|nr:hypothetical protein [bacterium]
MMAISVGRKSMIHESNPLGKSWCHCDFSQQLVAPAQVLVLPNPVRPAALAREAPGASYPVRLRVKQRRATRNRGTRKDGSFSRLSQLMRKTRLWISTTALLLGALNTLIFNCRILNV